MQIEHVTLGHDGRIVIPIAARRDLGLKPGETLIVESDGTSLPVRSYDTVVQETQDYFRQFAGGASIVDELIADRRLEAAREDAEANEAVTRTGRD